MFELLEKKGERRNKVEKVALVLVCIATISSRPFALEAVAPKKKKER